VFWLTPATAAGGPIFYNKFILADGVAAGAGLHAGAVVETWAGHAIKDDEKVTFFERPAPNPITEESTYRHAISQLTDNKNINGGTPEMVIKPTGVNVAFGPGTTALYGPQMARAEDSHTFPNKATAEITVVSEATLETKIKNKIGAPIPKTFNNVVSTTLEGSATAGKPLKPDMDTYHSADSLAGIFIEGARFFVKDQGLPGPFELAIKTQVFHLAPAAGSHKDTVARLTDPLFMTLFDLDTGVESIERIMTFDVEASAADVVINDLGILLAVDLSTPAAFARLAFDQPSSWVVDPYSYSARLDSAGLVVTGDTIPASGWQISSTAGRLEAFFPFGPDGQLFDFASVVPDSSLFINGNTYRYSVGGTGAAVEVAVPEPATVALMLIGGSLLGARARRCSRRRGRFGASDTGTPVE
jgi:hypothetical protein